MEIYGNYSFESIFDIGDNISSTLISYPIKRMIKSAAEQEGLDLKNPIRLFMSSFGSFFMGMGLFGIMGPFGLVFGEITGYGFGTLAKYPGDRKPKKSIDHEKLWKNFDYYEPIDYPRFQTPLVDEFDFPENNLHIGTL